MSNFSGRRRPFDEKNGRKRLSGRRHKAPRVVAAKVINLQACRKRMSLDKNHELALLSNLMNIAIEHAWHPCQFMQNRQVELRAPSDRSAGPTRTQCISGLAFQARAVQQNSGTHGRIVALAGSRRVEFLDLQMPQIGMEAKAIRSIRTKQYRKPFR